MCQLFFLNKPCTNDLLTFKLSDGLYRAVICAEITQQHGICTYDLIKTTYKSVEKPTLKNIMNCDIIGRWIGSSYDKKTMIDMQPGLDKLWELHNFYTGMFWGVSYSLVTHKDFFDFKHNFEKIGMLKIKKSYKQSGGYGYESSFGRFENIFSDISTNMQMYKEQGIRIKEIIETDENKK